MTIDNSVVDQGFNGRGGFSSTATECKHPVGDDDVEEVDTEDADGAAGGYRSNDDGREEDVA